MIRMATLKRNVLGAPGKRLRRCHLHNLAAPTPENDLVELSPYRSQRGLSYFDASRGAEDPKRVRALQSTAALCASNGRPKLAEQMEALARKIEAGGPTLASYDYLSEIRRRFSGAVLEHVRPLAPDEVAFVVLSPSDWSVPENKLRRFDPKTLLVRFRRWMTNGGPLPSNGFLVAVMDFEHDPQAHAFRPHLNLVASGEMLQRVKELRVRSLSRKGGRVVQAIRHPEAAVSYLVKPFCGGKMRPSGGRGRHRRVQEPAHSRFLLFLDRHCLGDFTAMIGCRIEGGRLTVRRSTKPVGPSEQDSSIAVSETGRTSSSRSHKTLSIEHSVPNAPRPIPGAHVGRTAARAPTQPGRPKALKQLRRLARRLSSYPPRDRAHLTELTDHEVRSAPGFLLRNGRCLELLVPPRTAAALADWSEITRAALGAGILKPMSSRDHQNKRVLRSNGPRRGERFYVFDVVKLVAS